jgi:hypothetical protein
MSFPPDISPLDIPGKSPLESTVMNKVLAGIVEMDVFPK